MEFRKKEYAPFDIFDSEYFTVSFLHLSIKKHLHTLEVIQEIKDYYELYSDIYTDGHGGWEPHCILIGEIEEIIE